MGMQIYGLLFSSYAFAELFVYFLVNYITTIYNLQQMIWIMGSVSFTSLVFLRFFKEDLVWGINKEDYEISSINSNPN